MTEPRPAYTATDLDSIAHVARELAHSSSVLASALHISTRNGCGLTADIAQIVTRELQHATGYLQLLRVALPGDDHGQN